MKMHPLYPMTFRPQYRNALWGGNTIAARYNRGNAPAMCAESWELCGMDTAPSIVSNGAFEGVTLTRLVQAFGRDLVGAKAPTAEAFPLMVRLLDVRASTSLHVHPNTEVATRLAGACAKHEMWYFLDVEPGASCCAGVTAGVTPETAAEHVQRFETKRGDVYDIPAGMVHALGAGNLVYEVSQASDTCYRMDDWGRGRELHRDAALQAMDGTLTTAPLVPPTQSRRDLQMRLATPDFTFATLNLQRARSLHTTAQSFMVLFCTEGKATLDHEGPHPLTLFPGDLVLIPPKQQVTLRPLMPTYLLVTTL